LKKLSFVIILLIIPFIIFISSLLLNKAEGNYPIVNFYDPDYVYLVNSLNIAQFESVGHVDHPGTPVQIIGAGVILTKYLISGQSESIVSSVLNNPEEYISAINKVLVVFLSFAIFILGYITYKFYSKIFMSLFLQTSCFASTFAILSLTRITPELLLMTIQIVVIISILFFINKKFDYGLKFILLFSFLTALGIATKITYAPLFFIPFFLFKGLKDKILYFFFTIISILVCVIPALSATNILYFYKWVKGLLTHGGIYGKGAKEFLNPGEIFQNLKMICVNDSLLILVFLIVIMTIILRIIFKKNFRISNDVYFQILLGIFISISFQIFIVAKHYGVNGDRYLIPSFMFIIPSIYFSISNLLLIFEKKFLLKYFYIIYLGLTIFFLSSGLHLIRTWIRDLEYLKKSSLDYREEIKNKYSDASKVWSYGVSSQEFALHFGTSLASTQIEKYQNYLSNVYPNEFFWGYPGVAIYSFTKNKNIQTGISKGNKLIFLGNSESEVKLFVEYLEKEYSSTKINYKKSFSDPTGSQLIFEINLE
jgi:hypothetical protein